MLPCLCVQNLLSIGFRTEMQLMTGVRRKQVSFTSQKCGHGKKYVVASLVSCCLSIVNGTRVFKDLRFTKVRND